MMLAHIILFTSTLDAAFRPPEFIIIFKIPTIMFFYCSLQALIKYSASLHGFSTEKLNYQSNKDKIHSIQAQKYLMFDEYYNTYELSVDPE